MLDYIIEAAIGYVFGDWLTKKVTDKHIHEHVFAWWGELRDAFSSWLNENEHLGVNRVAVVVLEAVDDLALITKRGLDRVTLAVYGITRNDQEYEVVSQEVPLEEALKMFPDLQKSAVIVDEISS